MHCIYIVFKGSQKYSTTKLFAEYFRLFFYNYYHLLYKPFIVNTLQLKKIFEFTDHKAQWLADYLKVNKQTVYNWRDDHETIPYGKILLLEKLITTQPTNQLAEPPQEWQNPYTAEIEKLKQENQILINTINILSTYNHELQQNTLRQ